MADQALLYAAGFVAIHAARKMSALEDCIGYFTAGAFQLFGLRCSYVTVLLNVNFMPFMNISLGFFGKHNPIRKPQNSTL